MYKLILALSLLFLAPAAAFGQSMCCEQQVEVYYSDIYADDSQADPVDQDVQGVLILHGLGYAEATSNPYGHSFSSEVQVFVPSGGYYGGYGSVSFTYDGTPGQYTSQATHTISCPICNCSWTSNSNKIVTFDSPSYTELYYRFSAMITLTETGHTCGYAICEWSKGCECGSNFLRWTATYKCECGTPCSEGLVQEYRIHRLMFGVLGIEKYCTFHSKRPLSFDPCVPVPPWNPECSITNWPQLPFP